jgi:hypothetical protein
MFSKTRTGLTPADCEFISRTLGATASDREEILASCADPSSVTAYLRDARLFERSMTPPPVFLGISPGLFFYVFVYRALERRSIADDDVVDYVAAVCTEFRSTGPLLQVTSADGTFFYITDLLNLMDGLDGARRHILRKYIGDVTLFLTGFFPGFFLRRTERRGAPAIGFYQEVARSQYCDAALDPDARDEQTADVLMTLSERFAEVRTALNEMWVDTRLIGRRREPPGGSVQEPGR